MRVIFRLSFLFTACLLGIVGSSIAAEQPKEKPKLPPGAVYQPIRVDPHAYLKKIKLPPGFKISIFADKVAGARSLSLSPNGTLFVGTFREWGKEPYKKVYAIRDIDKDYKADEIIVIADGLNFPNGVAFRDGALYVGEISRILRYDGIEENLLNPPAPVVIKDDYPSELHHGKKFIRFGPDGKLYVPVGAPCNVCEPEPTHGVITRINPDGSGYEVYAKGIRNSVGFDWHPQTGELWFTDNGRDQMGNDIPPEELNRAPQPGLHFGYPYRYGKALVDPTFPTELTDEDFQPAALEMPAHTAAIGMRFYTGDSFPEHYKNQIFIAHHGSWNRSPPDGFRVSVALLRGNEVVGYEDFASGWLIGDEHWGRLSDLEIMPDGSLLVSDELSHCIYRISYEG